MKYQIKSKILCISTLFLLSSPSYVLADDCAYVLDKIEEISQRASTSAINADTAQAITSLSESLKQDIQSLDDSTRIEACKNAKVKVDTLSTGITALENEAKKS